MTKTELNTACLNETNRYINKYLPEVMKALSTHIGLKITLSNPEIESKKFTVPLPPPFKAKKPYYFCDINAWYIFNEYSVIMHVKTCINGGSYDVTPATAFCEYYDTVIYIGKIESQVLTGIEEIDYTRFEQVSADNIEQDIKDFEVANELARKAFYKIPEHVRIAKYLRIG